MLFNKTRAMEYMRSCEVDVLIATSPVNITYFSDYGCWLSPLFKEYMSVPGGSSDLEQAYAVFPLEGEPALVIRPIFAVNAADLWVRDLHIFGDSGLDDSMLPGEISGNLQRFYKLFHTPQSNTTPTDALLSILKARGLTGSNIGLEMEGLPRGTKDTIARALPHAVIKDCTNLIRLIRMVKTTEEIVRLTRSAEINEQIGMESLVMAQPGMPVAEIVRHYKRRITELGADFNHFDFSVRGLGIATESNYVLTHDDFFYVDFGCIYGYYFSDTGTTLVMRQLKGELQKRYIALRACQEAGVKAIRPGVKASAVRTAMLTTLNAHGITASFPHGHALGLEPRDYPIIVDDNGLRIRDDCVDVPSDLPLEMNMVLNLEVANFIPGVGAYSIEQSFVVTPETCRFLVPQDRTQPVLPSVAK